MTMAGRRDRDLSREEIDALARRGRAAVERARALRVSLRQTASANRQQAVLLWLEGCRYEIDRRKRRSATFRSWLPTRALAGCDVDTMTG